MCSRQHAPICIRTGCSSSWWAIRRACASRSSGWRSDLSPSPTTVASASHDAPVSDAQIGTRRIYTGRIINLDVDTVRYPDGSEGELEMVRHPGASAIVPFLSDPLGEDPQLLLIRQYRYAADRYLYEIPAGK